MKHRMAGWIIYKGFPYHKGLHRFIEKQVTKWASATASEREVLTDSNYRVVFDQESAGGLIGCRVEVRIRTDVWVALEVARSAHEALTHGLQHMKYLSDPSLHPNWVKHRSVLSKIA